MTKKLKNKIFIVTGLSFGDEGKGSIVDFLCRTQDISYVSRYNGGSQAGHHIVLENNNWHCFRQFGSGMFIEGVKTYLSNKMFIDPKRLIIEELELKAMGVKNSLKRIKIDANAPVILPFNIVINRMKESAQVNGRIGTVGMGVGDAVFDHRNKIGIVFKDLFDQQILNQKILKLVDIKKKEAIELIEIYPKLQRIIDDFKQCFDVDHLTSLYNNYADYFKENLLNDKQKIDINDNKNVVFEGAQGVLLDCDFGFYPYVTKTSSLSKTVLDILKKRFNGYETADIETIGVLRGYSHRHGPGPFVTETKDNDLTNKLADKYDNPWQGPFRIGWLDMIMMKYSLSLNPVDTLALTNIDRLAGIDPKICISYKFTPPVKDSDIDNLDYSLGKHFEYETTTQNEIRITGFSQEYLKSPTLQNSELTDILFHCKPDRFKKFNPWSEDIHVARSYKELPFEAKVYLKFIEDELDVPIKIISVGPSWIEKF